MTRQIRSLDCFLFGYFPLYVKMLKETENKKTRQGLFENL